MNKLLALALTIAFSSFASAATDDVVVPAAAVNAESSFQAIDTNLDGVISLTEAENQKQLLEAFPTLDVDKTGDLSENEYKKFAMAKK